MASGDEDGSLRSVSRALLGNTFVAGLKFAAASLTGSSAMVSEGFHSVGYVINQLALFIGIKRGTKRSDRRFPFGRGKERYAWNMIAVMVVGFLGGITALHGFHAIHSGHLPDYLENTKIFWVVQAVLGASLLIEGYTLWVAKRVVWQQKGEETLFDYIRESSDPTGYAVLFEDSIAVFGILIAAAGIWLAVITGNPIYDGISAMIIAAMMLGMAIFLLFINMTLITGRSDPELEKEIEKFIMSHPSVERVHRISTEMRGANIISADVWLELKEEAVFHHISNGSDKSRLTTTRVIVEATYAHVTALVDDIRRSICAKFPEVEFLCIEPEFPKRSV